MLGGDEHFAVLPEFRSETGGIAEVDPRQPVTDAEIARLAAIECISTPAMESIAVRYLGVPWSVVESQKQQHRDDPEGLNRALLFSWLYRNRGPYERSVRVC